MRAHTHAHVVQWARQILYTYVYTQRDHKPVYTAYLNVNQVMFAGNNSVKPKILLGRKKSSQWSKKLFY